jgi:hypothetical protein
MLLLDANSMLQLQVVEREARRKQLHNNAVQHYWLSETATWQSNKGSCGRAIEESSSAPKVGGAPIGLESVIGTRGQSQSQCTN